MRGIIAASAVLGLGLGGCATVVEGTSQSIAIQTQPPGASCTVSRTGEQLGAIISTPGSVHVDKSKNDISVTCAKEGYQTTTVSYSSSFNGATFGNIILGGGIGAVVDASTGANYNYPKEVTLAMPEAVVAAPAAATAPVVAAVTAPVAKPAKPTPKPMASAAPTTQAVAAPLAPDPTTRTMKPVAD